MIAFASAVTDARVYERCAEPGIKLASEPDSEVLAFGSASSIFRSYNLILDKARGRDLEALVLLHQDAEIVDPNFLATARRALEDPDVALVGCGGAVGVRSIAWWEGSVTWASFTTRFEEMGGGEVPGMTWKQDEIPSYARLGEVETIDGFVIVMSPWAIENLRFDESLGRLHGYDLDLCLQARAAGKKVVTADFRVIHHHSLELIGDKEGWIAAHMQIAEKWEGLLPDHGGENWKLRARRAEAESDCTRLEIRLAEQIVNVQRAELDSVVESKSWKLTAPLRRAGDVVRRLRGPKRAERKRKKRELPRGEGIHGPGADLLRP